MRLLLPTIAVAASAAAGLAWHTFRSPETTKSSPLAEEATAAILAALPVPDLPDPPTGLVADIAEAPRKVAALFERTAFGDFRFRPALIETLSTARFASLSEPVASPPIEAAIRRETARLDSTLKSVEILPPRRPDLERARRQLASADIVDVTRADDGGAAAARPSTGLFSGWPALPGFKDPTGAEDDGRPGRAGQSGLASWYGPGFHGRRTASGERFDQYALTAAHRTLPFGTRVRVVDPATGRSIVVRINDRGPFAHGRIIDLSKGSAQALGLLSTSRVKIVALD